MEVAYGLFLAISILIAVVFFGESKILTFYILAVLCLIFGLNNHHLGFSEYYNMDFHNYYLMFLANSNHISELNTEIGFQFLMFAANKIGLSFNMFRLGVAIFGYAIIYKVLARFTRKVNYVLALYVIYPFLNDVIQIRNFLAMSIVVLAISCLVNEGTKAMLKYCVLISFASLIHISSIFYFLLLLARVFSTKTLAKIVLLGSVLIIPLSYTDFYPRVASLVTSNDKILGYFTRRTTTGMILIFFVLAFFFLTYYLIFRAYARNTSRDFREVSNRGLSFDSFDRLSKTIYSINILLLLTAPLLIYNFNFIRFYRNILVINYAVIVEIIFRQKDYRRGFEYSLVALFFVGFLFVLFYAMHAETQIYPVLGENALL